MIGCGRGVIPRFFELTGLPFARFHADNWGGSRQSLNASTHIRF